MNNTHGYIDVFGFEHLDFCGFCITIMAALKFTYGSFDLSVCSSRLVFRYLSMARMMAKVMVAIHRFS
jgi:hypothetical protein